MDEKLRRYLCMVCGTTFLEMGKETDSENFYIDCPECLCSYTTEINRLKENS